MGKMHLAIAFVCVVLLHSPLYASAGDQGTKQETPTKAVVLSAIDRAERSLKNYQLTLGKFQNIQEVAATATTDSQPVLVGGMAVILLRSELSQGQDVNPLELATLFANVDAAAINAALTSGTLAVGADTGPNGRKKLIAAKALIASVQELKDSSDRLWTILEAHLKSQKAWRVAVSPPQGTGAGSGEYRNVFLFVQP
jgi:hypothetical protein